MSREPKGPQYRHLVWNRTDLTQSAGNLSTGYSAAQPPAINERFPPDGYKGEAIPPFAVMRVLTNPVWYKDRICWPVCRPDDTSLMEQATGIHFINGPTAIPMTFDKSGMPNGYGEATNDLPAPVLLDFTADPGIALPYGGSVGITGTGAALIGDLVGYCSGSWAVHPVSDMMNQQDLINGDFKTVVTAQIPSGSISAQATPLPYVVIGQHPLGLSRRTPRPNDSPTLAFNYSSQIVWVGNGALGFATVSSQGSAGSL